MREINVIVYDIGSTYTKAAAFALDKGELFFLGRTQSPTTVENIGIGAQSAKEKLLSECGLSAAEDVRQYASCSAAGGLRMVAMGYMPRVTAKAAKEVAMTAGARVMEVISSEEPPLYRLEVLREIRPDIILLAGGTDCGDESSVLENTKLICESKTKATVIIACNRTVQSRVANELSAAGIAWKRVANIMPTIHELNIRPSRETIHEQFIKQITQAGHVEEFVETLSDKMLIPTPGAVLLATELLACGTHEQEGVGSVLTVDIGGATTDIHSVIPDLSKLKPEEKGLVINNEKQVTYRTVEGNLGMRVSALGILDAVGSEAIVRKANREGISLTAEELTKRLEHMECCTRYVPDDKAGRVLDIRLACAAASVALRRHAGTYAAQSDPVMGIMAGTAMGRDLRYVGHVICCGGVFAHSDKETCEKIMKECLGDPGISLLPIDMPEVFYDKDYILYVMGVLGRHEPEAVLCFMKRYFKKNKS